MSLSTIAQILQGMEPAETPGKLDQIIDANKKKRRHREKNTNPAGDTYTLIPSSRASMPATTPISKGKPGKDVTRSSLGNKLSLDSRNISEFDNNNFSDLIKEADLLQPKLNKLSELISGDTLSDEIKNNQAFCITDTTITDDRLSIGQSINRTIN